MTLFYVPQELHNPSSGLTAEELGQKIDAIVEGLYASESVQSVDVISSGNDNLEFLVGVEAESGDAAAETLEAALVSAFQNAGMMIQAESKQFAMA